MTYYISRVRQVLHYRYASPIYYFASQTDVFHRMNAPSWHAPDPATLTWVYTSDSGAPCRSSTLVLSGSLEQHYAFNFLKYGGRCSSPALHNKKIKLRA